MGVRPKMLHAASHQPMRQIADQSSERNKKAERAAARRVRHRFHQGGLHHRIARHEEETIQRECRDEPLRRHSRENPDQCHGDEQHDAGPANPPAVAQMAEERVADDRRQENGAQCHAGLAEVEPTGVLQEKRAETAHAAAGEIAQAKNKTHGHKQKA